MIVLQPADPGDYGPDPEEPTIREILDDAKERQDAWIAEKAKADEKEALAAEAERVVFGLKARELGTKLHQQRLREDSDAADPWERVDLRAAYEEGTTLPTVGKFVDSDSSNGGHLFYAGKVNEIHGGSESGKTMVLLAVAAQEIRDGNDVIMIDFEDDGGSIAGRLLDVFGLTWAEITEHFHYFRSDQAFNDRAFDVMKAIPGVTLGIIDAVTEAMTASGLDGRNENEVAAWYMEFPRRLATLGMAVCLVDHTPQADLARAIGSQHKKAAITGVSYSAISIAKFTKGRSGRLRLHVAKDKMGGVRPHALPHEHGQEWRGDFVIDGRGDPSRPVVALYGVDPAAIDSAGQGAGDDSALDRDVMPGAPTWEQREQVLAAIRTGGPNGSSTNYICTSVGARKENTRAVLEYMRETKEILWTKEGNAYIHQVKPEPKPEPEQPELE